MRSRRETCPIAASTAAVAVAVAAAAAVTVTVAVAVAAVGVVVPRVPRDKHVKLIHAGRQCNGAGKWEGDKVIAVSRSRVPWQCCGRCGQHVLVRRQAYVIVSNVASDGRRGCGHVRNRRGSWVREGPGERDVEDRLAVDGNPVAFGRKTFSGRRKTRSSVRLCVTRRQIGACASASAATLLLTETGRKLKFRHLLFFGGVLFFPF